MLYFIYTDLICSFVDPRLFDPGSTLALTALKVKNLKRKNTFTLQLRLPICEIFQLFARLFILFYRSPMYETFRTESKIK